MRLDRNNLAKSAGESVARAPERIVHLGIGAFAKAHQIWYTSQVDSENQWGVVAFTGRTATIADQLQEQDGLYTLVERSPEGDKFQFVKSIVRAVDGNDATDFTEAIANPQIALITITITESGYVLSPPSAAIHRLAVALDIRRRLNAEPIALVPCDNIPNNGERLREVLLDIFRGFEPEATTWLNTKVSFVSTSIDRITPRTTDEDLNLVARETGWQDKNVTVTEPFSDWVLCGDFPKGRPEWQLAGAKFVENIEPFENRKLWLLNGAHSILAYSGLTRGYETVAEAIADVECLAIVEKFWNEASRHLLDPNLEIDKYRAALLRRFSNDRIAHQLSQIALDGATKVAVRLVPVALAELASGNDASGAALGIGTWINFVREQRFIDSRADEIRLALQSPQPSQALLALLSPDLASSEVFINQLKREVPC